jgi:hypothetical protein
MNYSTARFLAYLGELSPLALVRGLIFRHILQLLLGTYIALITLRSSIWAMARQERTVTNEWLQRR